MAKRKIKGYDIMLERDELHESFGGGIPKGSIVLVEGNNSSGKSIFCQRIMYGFLENKHTVNIVSTELTVKTYVEQMYSLDYKVATYFLNDKLKYFPVYPLIDSALSRTDFLEKLMKAEHLFDSDIIIIDTLSSLIKNSMVGDDTCIKFISFLKRIAASGKTIVLAIDPFEMMQNELQHFQAAASVYLSMKRSSIGGNLLHILEVNRFLNAEGSIDSMVSFKVESKVGIIIEIMEVG